MKFEIMRARKSYISPYLYELGHAIGLGHLTSDGAVMNPLRELGKGDFHLNAADVEAAYNFCRGK